MWEFGCISGKTFTVTDDDIKEAYEALFSAELREMREERDNLRKLFEHMALDAWGVPEFDGGDFQYYAVQQGLLVEVPADETFKAEYDCDVMFTFSWSPLADAAKEKSPNES